MELDCSQSLDNLRAVGGGEPHWAQNLASLLQRFVTIYLPQKEYTE